MQYAMKTWGSGGIATPFLTSALDGVVSFTPLPLYPWGNNPRYPLDRRLGGRAECCTREKNLVPPGIKRRYNDSC
jgi:hypothetical protein